MSRPELPPSPFGKEKHPLRGWLELALGLALAWELVWFVLVLGGARPHGQIWSVPGRMMSATSRALAMRPYPGGAFHIYFGVSHPVALLPVALVIVGLVLVAVVVLHFVERGLPTREPRQGGRGNGGKGGSSRPQQPVAAARNTRLRDWLDDQADGKD